MLINTNGLALIGPGSEWFWSMLQFVIVAVTLVGIYYQLRSSQSANAFTQLGALVDEWNGERLTRKRMTLRNRSYGPRSQFKREKAVCMFSCRTWMKKMPACFHSDLTNASRVVRCVANLPREVIPGPSRRAMHEAVCEARWDGKMLMPLRVGITARLRNS
jgi:hypothetical protein